MSKRQDQRGVKERSPEGLEASRSGVGRKEVTQEGGHGWGRFWVLLDA